MHSCSLTPILYTGVQVSYQSFQCGLEVLQVFRLSKMLGWVPANADREKTYLHMNRKVPDDIKFDLHCLLVTHGKRCPRCAKGGRAQTAPDGPCPLVNWSPKEALNSAGNLKLLKAEEA